MVAEAAGGVRAHPTIEALLLLTTMTVSAVSLNQTKAKYSYIDRTRPHRKMNLFSLHT